MVWPRRETGPPDMSSGRERGSTAARRLRRATMKRTAAAGGITCGCRDACPAAERTSGSEVQGVTMRSCSAGGGAAAELHKQAEPRILCNPMLGLPDDQERAQISRSSAAPSASLASAAAVLPRWLELL